MPTNLQLKRPLALIDLETTGTNVTKDRIIEISILKIQPDGSRTVKTRRVNPTIPIPEETVQWHGIRDEDVKDEPTFAQLAGNLFKFIYDCDLGGFNSNKFDIPMLVEEFLRAEIEFDVKDRFMVDVQNIFHKMEQRTLVAAYQFYCDKELVNAHSAEADIVATYEVLEAQLLRYDDLGRSMEELHDISKRHDNVDLMGRIVFNEDKVPVFNFGKHKGKPVEEVLKKEPGYYGWMMNGDFPLNTKKVLTELWKKSR